MVSSVFTPPTEEASRWSWAWTPALTFASGRENDTIFQCSPTEDIFETKTGESCLTSSYRGLGGKSRPQPGLPTWNVARMFILLVLSNQMLVQFLSDPIFKTLAKFFCFPEMFRKRQNQIMAENTWFLDSWPKTHTLNFESPIVYP